MSAPVDDVTLVDVALVIDVVLVGDVVGSAPVVDVVASAPVGAPVSPPLVAAVSVAADALVGPGPGPSPSLAPPDEHAEATSEQTTTRSERSHGMDASSRKRQPNRPGRGLAAPPRAVPLAVAPRRGVIIAGPWPSRWR
ncbi:MAG: hypothetical protein JNL82_34130 [Myxococcales bacterium]|nr:hypothetical protein [Myxococcales bacterium]